MTRVTSRQTTQYLVDTTYNTLFGAKLQRPGGVGGYTAIINSSRYLDCDQCLLKRQARLASRVL